MKEILNKNIAALALDLTKNINKSYFNLEVAIKSFIKDFSVFIPKSKFLLFIKRIDNNYNIFPVRKKIPVFIKSPEKFVGSLSLLKLIYNSNNIYLYTFHKTIIKKNDMQVCEFIVSHYIPIIEKLLLYEDIDEVRKDWQIIAKAMKAKILFCDSKKNVKRSNIEFCKNIKCYNLLFNRKKSCTNCMWDSALKTGKSKTFRIRNANKIFEISLYPIKNSKDRVVEIARDITKQEENIKLLKQYEKSKTLQKFTTGLAHNLNNHLTIIMGNTEKIISNLKTNKKLKQKKDLNNIINATKHIAEMINNLQKISRGEVEKSLIDINSIILKVIIDIKNLDIFNNIEIKYKKNVINHYISGKKNEIYVMFFHICKNAVEACSLKKKNIIRISLSHNNSHINCTISDTGTGINKSIIEKIFYPFFSTKGTEHFGLGLTTVNTIVTDHNGEIHINSDKKKTFTTTVKILLPTSSKIKIKKRKRKISKYKEKKILVIDDEEVIRSMIKSVLESENYIVEDNEGKQDILNKIISLDYSLIITDLGMPEISGWQVSQTAAQVGIPVIMITGWGNQIIEKEAFEKGVTVLISKPFKIKKLLDSVENILKIIPE